MALYTADLSDAEAIVDSLFGIYDTSKSSNSTEKHNKKQDWLEANGLLYLLREAVSANNTSAVTSYLAELNLFAAKAGESEAGSISPLSVLSRPITGTVSANTDLDSLTKNTDYLLDTDTVTVAIEINTDANDAWEIGDSIRFFHSVPTNGGEITTTGVTLHSIGTTISSAKKWTTITKVANLVFTADGNLE